MRLVLHELGCWMIDGLTSKDSALDCIVTICFPIRIVLAWRFTDTALDGVSE
jgi:hypothetical protein